MSDELKKRKDELDAKIKKIDDDYKNHGNDEKSIKERLKLKDEEKKVMEDIKKSPPKGNVYELNSKKWRKRGWMEYAYPSIGKGAIVPTDWVGLGCTLLSPKALSLAHFDGYLGKGTQDLYLGWHRWKQNKLNMCVTTHSICDHVIRARDKNDSQIWENFIIVNTYHEEEGEYEGHLRQVHTPFYNFTEGELPKEEKIQAEKEEDEKV